MKRIVLLFFVLSTAAWATGCCCCHPYYSRYDCDDGYAQRQPRYRGRLRHQRGDRGERYDGQDGCYGDGCDSCCNSCCPMSGGAQIHNSASPMTYEGSPMMGTCAGSCAGGMMNGGCASGNCGEVPQTYGGLPFDPSEGWTVQSVTSHPVGNEPTPVPGSVPTPATPAPSTPVPQRSTGWTPSASSAPVPGPVPPTIINR